MPAIAFGSGAADAQVASQVADSILTELINKDVGQGALDDAAKVKCRRRSQGRRASGRGASVAQETWLSLCTVVSLGNTLTAGWSGAWSGFGDVATTPPESRASNSVPSTDAHLSVASRTCFLSLTVQRHGSSFLA